MRIRLVTSGELPDLWWALRVLIDLAQYLSPYGSHFSHHNSICSAFTMKSSDNQWMS